MKRFLAISLLAIVCAVPARPCVPERPTHNAYMFSVFRRESVQNPFAERFRTYWSDYLGLTPASSYAWYEWDKEVVLQAARKKQDSEMQAYAALFDKYMTAVEAVKQDVWDYPTKQQLQARNANLRSVLLKANAYKGTKMRQQYALLTMRANMMLARDKANIAYWTATASRMPDGVWRDAMQNIYARALYKTGEWRKATDIYAQQGDMQSMKWLVRKYRNIAGIKSIYAQDPNSPTLLYLVQDFVNSAQETIDQRPSSIDDEEWLKAVGASAIYEKDVKEFLNFADVVLKDGKTTSPCLWRSAQGMLQYLFGHNKEAMTAMDEAVGMAGTQRMKDNARAIRLLVSTRSNAVGTTYSDYLVREMKWLDSKISEEGMSEYDVSNHYTDVLERVVWRGLVPLYDESGKSDVATMLIGMLRRQEVERYGNTKTNGNVNYSAWNEYFTRLDCLSADKLSSYYEYLAKPKKDAFESFVAAQVYQDADYYNDLIGTKMIAEGRYADAIPYLQKVSMDFVNGQDISFFSSRRDYNVERWFHRQHIKGDDFFSNEAADEQPVMTQNPKLSFCRDMVDLHSKFSVARPDGTREQLAYRLATLTCQASHFGDCWYLTHYGKSVSDSARVGELDHIAATRQYLDVAKAGADLQLRYKALYALALVSYDNWYDVSYDDNFNEITTLKPHSQRYMALQTLSDFAMAYPQAVDEYTTKCDVLQRFRNQTSMYKSIGNNFAIIPICINFALADNNL